jgi:hypothetical protein
MRPVLDSAEDNESKKIISAGGSSGKAARILNCPRRGSCSGRVFLGFRMNDEIKKRRTFAIISHPDAGKTTLPYGVLLRAGRAAANPLCIIGLPIISIETFDPEIKYHRFRKIGKNGSPKFT